MAQSSLRTSTTCTRRTCQRRYSSKKLFAHDQLHRRAHLPPRFQKKPIDMASSTMEEAKLPGGYLVTPRVPQGLAAAVEGLTREVIRHSPEDIYVFAAHHFEKLLELREQCGIVKGKSSNRDGRMDTLREMNRALREREVDRESVKTTRNTTDQIGWSLNQTAKVLKRHRSIFGDEGRRITTDEVFQMATHKGNRSRSPKSPTKNVENRGKRSTKEKTRTEKSDDIWKASTSRAENSWPKDHSIDDDNADKTKTGPKIITRISNLPSGNVMLAKDIKTELRKNRISSRERRNVRARQESKDTTERSDGKVVRSSGKNCSTKKSLDRQKRIETDVEDEHSRKNYYSTRSSSSSKEFQPGGKSHDRDGSKGNKENAKIRTSSMDRVRDYVIERFATTKSLEELQTLDYIEKVQKIIDETGPIIRDKVEQLKSGMIGGSDGNSFVPETRKIRERRFDDSPGDKNEGLSERKYSPEISPAETSTKDALITRLAETRNLLDNVSSGLTKSSRRSRSARSCRRSEHFRMNYDAPEASRVGAIAFGNRDNGLETKLSKTRDLLKDISSTLSRPMRRSCSATSLNKRCETMEDVAGNKDALKNRLDETRNLLKGISASFGKFTEETSNKRMTIDFDESFGPGDENLSKTSLPAVKSVSVKNSSSSASRSDSGNLVLPAISPEVPKSSKIKEDLILPILSPPSTASTNEDSSNVLDINDDVPLEDFGITETPVQDYVPEVPIDNVSRDSLNVTPDFDSIPQRPDSLEPVGVTDDLDTDGPDVRDLEMKSRPADDLGSKFTDNDDPETTAEVDLLGARTLELDEDHISDARLDASQTKTTNSDDLRADATITDDPHPETSRLAGLEARLQEIQKVEMDIEEIFGSQTKSDSQKSENSDALNKPRELEDVETQVSAVSRMYNPDEDEKSGERAEMPVDSIEMPANSGENVEEEMKAEKNRCKLGEDDLTEKDDKMGLGDNDDDKLLIISPESVNYTYVLTEGSPYDIPDTVTTVIIPERIIDSPLSDRLRVELEDGVEAKLSLLSDHSEEEKSLRNNVDKNIERKDTFEPELVEEPTKDFNEIDTISSLDSEAKLFLSSELETDERSIEHIVEKSSIEPDFVIEAMKDSSSIDAIPSQKIQRDIETIADQPMKNPPESSDKDDPSSRDISDPFGELVQPEIITEISTNIDFIRELENIPEIQMSHQGLGPINEEVIEELEDFEDKRDAEKTTDDNAKVERDEEESAKEIEIFKEEKEGENGEKKTYLEIDESRIIESDLSPEGTRPSVCSESSNETKESSAADEAVESTKRERSMDEEVSSDTRTAESSNEVKETTLTDGLSLSLDPSRPYVPELNLDSLQDITVSSFKMTEEDNENREAGESENTNSITETLTSDENNRINDSREFMEEAVVEYLPSSSSKSNEIDDETEKRGEEAVEETIVKRQVEVKEDTCEKKSTYVTGPGGEEMNVNDNRVEPSDIEEGQEKREGNIAIAKKETLNPTKTVERVDEVKNEKQEEKTSRSEEEMVKTEQSEQTGNANIVEIEEEKKNDESGENVIDEKPGAASGETKLELDIVKSSEEMKNEGETSEDKTEKEPAAGDEELELDMAKSTEDESRSSEINVCTKSEISELSKKEEIVRDLARGRLSSDGTLENIEESTDRNFIVQDEVGKSHEDMRVEEEESDDVLEENDVDEETPLAVSRSASQCTTRRVSSGNLAKLRDHPTLERIDKIDDQDEKSEHDSSSSKVKFTDAIPCLDKTLEEEGRQKTEENLPGPRNDRTGDSATVKDSKEYHIYVPEVDASEGYSTTESSTFDSAVTKIQAGVRGFLTRRRLQRGQENRSSTLSSIPSIEDSIAIEPYRAEDRAREASEDKDPSSDKTAMASLKVSKDNEFVDAATRIQSNYRGYKARKRLRRENAVQRTTISLERSFGESGLQHTGEFHDCIPLPVHDITIEKKISDSTIEEKRISELDRSTKGERNWTDGNFDKSDETTVKSSTLLDPGKIIVPHSSNDPIIQFEVGPSISQLVDLVVLAKNNDALQTGYLNFITSVEDTETIVEPTEVGTKNLREDESSSRESLREPLALSGPPVGLIIEEITSSGPDNFMKTDEERDRTMASVNSSILPPEVGEESLAVSESKEGRQSAQQLNEQSQIDRKATGSPETPNERYKDAGTPEKMPEKIPDIITSDQSMASTLNPSEIVPLDSEPLIEDFLLPTSLSSMQEKELLGPESCVDSMEHPVVQIVNETASKSSDSATQGMASTSKVVEAMADKMPSVGKDRPNLSEEIDDGIKEESIGSNADDGSSKLSFSMKVEDLLDLGSEGNIELFGKKPVSEGTLKPHDLVKSMGLSQESQLADERIESPVTMIQIAPERTESLKHDDLSDDSEDEDANNGGKDGCSSASSKSGKK